jgi:hypothetical protein
VGEFGWEIKQTVELWEESEGGASGGDDIIYGGL